MSVYAENRAWALKNIKHLGGTVVLKGFETVGRPGTDYEWPLRQESNFFYLSGVPEEDAWIVWDLVENVFHSFVTMPPDDAKTWMKVESFESKKAKYSADFLHEVADLP